MSRCGLITWLLVSILSLIGCGSAGVAPLPGPAAAAAPPRPEVATTPEKDTWPDARGRVAGRGERLLVYLPAAGDTLAGIATRFLDRADRAWQIADANGQTWEVSVNSPLIVPLSGAPPPINVDADGYQTVPILCYHRFGIGASKMIVAPSQFEAQLAWLARHHYRVLRLADLAGFLAGREALPQRSVVITIDDGYESVYRHAFPLLKRYGFSATLFMYTDFIGAGEGLNWVQLQEMASSGLVDIQAHSKTHRNMMERGKGEADAAYRQNIELELRAPRQVLERKLSAAGVRVRYFAYPFGDANDWVLDAMRRNNYELGVTVNAGGNPFFAHPLMLRRTMIFGDHDLDDFKARMQTRKPLQRTASREAAPQ
jgi:peptidoglycan/xylan/chitin deacetylase (PgdA/CDA1 family)